MIEFLQEHLFECVFKKYAGIPCFGCGMQRAVILLLEGRLLTAMTMYPPLVPQFAMLGYLALHLRMNYKNGAKNLLWLFAITIIMMILNVILKLNTEI